MRNMWKKYKFILVFIFILTLGVVIYWGTAKLLNKEWIPSERAEKFYISSGETFPVFIKEVIVDPFRVKTGEKQIFSIWAKDFQVIEKVTAKISTDAEDELIELELVEGTKTEGRWMGSWITKNISAKSSYQTTFQALNKEGKETEMTLSWQVKVNE